MAVEDDLIWYLVWRVEQQEGMPTKTRLVKLTYLVDLLHVRDYRVAATSLRWRYYHFGPYSQRLEPVFERQLGQTLDRSDRLSIYGEWAFVYRSLYEPPSTLLPSRLLTIADRVSDEWATADLGELLNYVYFRTPPMRHAQRGEYLNLGRVLEEEWPPYYRPLTEPSISEDLRGRVLQWSGVGERRWPLARLEPDWPPPRHDGSYRALFGDEAEEDVSPPPLRGRFRPPTEDD